MLQHVPACSSLRLQVEDPFGVKSFSGSGVGYNLGWGQVLHKLDPIGRSYDQVPFFKKCKWMVYEGWQYWLHLSP